MGLRTDFTSRVLGQYSERSAGVIAASAGGLAKQSGHPAFDGLRLGERHTASVAALFLDLSNFTGRSFWDDADDVATLADAILGGFTEVVTRLNDHVLGLRGDGLFAGFGPGINNESVALAGLAAAAALDATENYLNPSLQQMGIHPVSARAGIDFGQLTFVRTGNEQTSEINVVGFAANLAAKAEKIANAWEVVVGQGFADHVANPDLIPRRDVKVFERNGERRRYPIYDLRWRRLLPELDGVVSDLSRTNSIYAGSHQ